MDDEKKKEATALLDKLSGRCLQVMLDWGQAVNRAEATKDGGLKDVSLSVAQLCGSEVLKVSRELARVLRPEAP